MAEQMDALNQFWAQLRAEQVGNTGRLKEYWKTGAGGAKIRWGSPGDLTRCHRLVRKEVPRTDMTDDQIWGYCQNLHKELFGRPNPQD